MCERFEIPGLKSRRKQAIKEPLSRTLPKLAAEQHLQAESVGQHTVHHGADASWRGQSVDFHGSRCYTASSCHFGAEVY